MPEPALACPTRDELAAWALGMLSDDRLALIEAHLGHCDACQRQTSGLDDLADSLLARMRGLNEGLPPAQPELTTLLARAEALVADPGTATSRQTLDTPPPARERLRHYELLGQLGAGGMGVVYQARDPHLGRLVAIKLLPKESRSEAHLARFKREWQAAALLDHPNMVRVFEGGEDEGRPYLVMEYLEGLDLQRRLANHGPLPIHEACDGVRQAALALQHAHDHGLLHRDVKPSNLMRSAQGQVKLLDLGLARSTDAESPPLTESGRVVGTLDYMAPEQFDAPSAVTVRADLYSLGCTFYALLTGTVPFPGGTLFEKMEAHRSRAPQPLAQLRPECPTEVLAMVNHLMEKAPGRRPASAATVAADLERICARLALKSSSQPAATDGPPRGEPPPATAPTPYRAYLLGAVLVLLLAAAAAALLLNSGTLRLQTPQGTLVLNFPQGIPADLDVLVDGQKVRVKNLDKVHTQLDIDVGDHLLEVREGGKVFQRQKKVEIVSGKKTVLTIEIDRGKKVGLVELPVSGKEEKLIELANMSGVSKATEAILNHLHFSPDGKLAVSTAINRTDIDALAVWDLERRTRIGKLYVTNGDAILCPLGCLLCRANGGEVLEIWNPYRDTMAKFPLSHPERVTSFALSPSKVQVAAGGERGLVEVWNLNPIKKYRTFAHGKVSLHTAYSGDARLLLTGADDGAVRVWDVEKDRQEKSYESPAAPDEKCYMVRVGLSDDGKRVCAALVRGTPGRPLRPGLVVWDQPTGKVLLQIDVGESNAEPLPALPAAFTPDGRRALTGHKDGTIKWWDLESGKELFSIQKHKGAVTCLDIDPLGRRALSGGQDRTLRFWQLPNYAAGKP